jgi:hypothetical protein
MNSEKTAFLTARYTNALKYDGCSNAAAQTQVFHVYCHYRSEIVLSILDEI